jgi:hypothetical protein
MVSDPQVGTGAVQGVAVDVIYLLTGLGVGQKSMEEKLAILSPIVVVVHGVELAAALEGLPFVAAD